MHDQACQKQSGCRDAGRRTSPEASCQPWGTRASVVEDESQGHAGGLCIGNHRKGELGQACPERGSVRKSVSPFQLWVQGETAALETRSCKLVFTHVRDFS